MIFTLNEFGYYLAGLWEGDGHSGKPPSAYISFSFHKKDFPLCLFCHHVLNGTLRYKEKENTWVLTIRKREDLWKLTELIGDKCRSPKATEIWQISKWLKYVFKKSRNSKTSSLSYSLDKQPLGENAWLCGFIDADAGFKVRYTRKKIDSVTKKVLVKERIALSMTIQQPMLHPKSGQKMTAVMEEIASFLTIRLTKSKHNSTIYYCVSIFSFKKLPIIINYLQKYSLLSSKRLDYQDWLKVYDIMTKKNHLTEAGKKRILFLKNEMNRKRQRFTWFHLIEDCSLVVIESEMLTMK